MTKGVPLNEAAGCDDDELIRACLKGDRRAFDDLVIRHRDRVFNLCYRFLGDFQEADDIAQEVFIKVYRSLNRFRFKAKFSTWLYRITINTCKNRIKSLEYKYKKWTGRLDDGNPYPGDERANTAADPSRSPLDRLERKERAMRINRAVNALSGDKKTVVVLKDIEGLTYDEISRITGLKTGTVKSRLARARTELQKKLKGLV